MFSQIIIKRMFCFVLLLLSLSTCMAANAEQADEEQLTASFIFQITKFVRWPENSAELNTFNICVLGHTSEKTLQYFSLFENKSTQGKPIRVKHIENENGVLSAPLNECKIVFISKDEEKKHTKESIEQMKNSSLLVGATEAFLAKGGMLSLIIKKNRMKIFISEQSLKDSEIKIQARLKALAVMV